ncbi:hypothetical protein NEMIN01_1368 [Nematocida minor]|uniref:uncharacterized protein n=1 Tax=Nematocida minor TaxID=1912983 RepID=UPI00221EE8C0|nr:uncharacterized protein NEMIN01_1368 [Nematocida minor]KAI5191099.1 hypothetical protein NEMIN01_1368 [Nematocida minor]
MNSSVYKNTSEHVVIDLLDRFESEKYTELVDLAWEILYSVIIPFNTEDIHTVLSNYIVVLAQAISVPSVSDEVTKILSIVDLIIHPRKGTIIEGKYEIDDLVEEIPSDTKEEPFEEEDSKEKSTNKKVKIDIIE